jgi:hypothetical protein
MHGLRRGGAPPSCALKAERTQPSQRISSPSRERPWETSRAAAIRGDQANATPETPLVIKIHEDKPTLFSIRLKSSDS